MCCHEDRHCHHGRHEFQGHECHGHREMSRSRCCHGGDRWHEVPPADRLGLLSKQVAMIKEKVEWLERELADISREQGEPKPEGSDKE